MQPARLSGRCGVWHAPLPDSLVDVASGRHRLPDAASARQSGRRPSGRQPFARLSGIAASGRQRLQDGIRQTASAGCRLLDTMSARRRVCQTVWHRPDGICRGRLADGIWQGRLADTSARLSGRRGVWQTASGRPGVWQTVSAGRYQADGVWQMRCLPDMVSARLSG